MPTYPVTIGGTRHTVDVPAANHYVQPNRGANVRYWGSGQNVAANDTWRAHAADGEGTPFSISGIQYHPRYRQTHFVSSYVSGQNTNNVGGVTIPNDRGYWSTAYLPTPGGSIVGGASQTITVPGQAGTYTVEAVIALNEAYLGRDDTNGHFVFGVQPDDEVEIGAGAWANHNFIIISGGVSYTIDGSTFLTASQNASTERWYTPDLGTTEWPKLRDRMLNGQTFELRIKSKV